MACYHPLKAFPVGITPKGKTDYKICSYDVDFLLWNGDKWEKHGGKPLFVNSNVVTEFVEIGCGQCIGCRLNYSRQWADRCMLELESHESAFFVTLTYNNEHIPLNPCVSPSTGEVVSLNMSLCKRDFQLFMKRLRKALPDQKLRYFAAGEYGSQTFRPHYHAIIFGLKLDDLVPFSRSEQGYQYFNSPTLDRAWSVDGELIGHVVVGHVSWDTCAYTARYICKKLKGAEAQFYSDLNIVPEFSLMSRKPGLAHDYYDKNKNLILLR